MIYTTYHAVLNHSEKVGCVAGAFYITSKHCFILRERRSSRNVKFSKIIFFWRGGEGYKIFYPIIWMRNEILSHRK